MELLSGQAAVITGAAHGIGRGIAELFLTHGARVMVGDILPIGPDDPLRTHGDRFAASICDVTDDTAVQKLIETAFARFGRIDCLVNNAGSPGPTSGLAEIEPEAFDKTIATVLRGVYSGIRHASPIMRGQKSGSIINMGSTSGLRAAPVLQPYSAAKAAVNMITQSAALELGPEGIRVNCICPGGIATALYGIAAGHDRQEAERRIDIMAANLASVQLLGRAGTPRDVANAALWLASDLSSYVTGQIIAVDGGMSVGRAMPPGVTPSQFFGKIAGND